MPADAGVDDRRASLLDGFREEYHLVPALAGGNQIQHGQAVDDDEVRAHRFPGPGHDLHRQLHAIGKGAAPLVRALVGVRHEKLVDQVALGAHHLHAVVARLPGQSRAPDESPDLALNTSGRQGPRLERRDG